MPELEVRWGIDCQTQTPYVHFIHETYQVLVMSAMKRDGNVDEKDRCWIRRPHVTRDGMWRARQVNPWKPFMSSPQIHQPSSILRSPKLYWRATSPLSPKEAWFPPWVTSPVATPWPLLGNRVQDILPKWERHFLLKCRTELTHFPLLNKLTVMRKTKTQKIPV